MTVTFFLFTIKAKPFLKVISRILNETTKRSEGREIFMDMNRIFYLKKEDRDPSWHVIDAKDQILGRLATKIADTLRGRDKAHFTHHTDTGDYVVVINAKNIKVTGNKFEDKKYVSYSGWIGGQKERTFKQLMAKDPTQIIIKAVKGMLPRNKLSREIIKKLKVYAGSEHPHKAQIK